MARTANEIYAEIRRRGRRMPQAKAAKLVPEMVALCQEYQEAVAAEAKGERKGKAKPDRGDPGGMDRSE